MIYKINYTYKDIGYLERVFNVTIWGSIHHKECMSYVSGHTDDVNSVMEVIKLHKETYAGMTLNELVSMLFNK